MRNLLTNLFRYRRVPREETVVQPRRTHVRIQMRDFAPIHIPIDRGDDPDRRAKLLARLRTVAEERVGQSSVRLVLPRHQYVTKRCSLPIVKAEFLDEMVRHQLDARLSTGVEGMYWDYQAELSAADAEAQSVVVYAAPRETVDDWRELLAQAGFVTGRVTVQTDEAISRIRLGDRDELLIVDAGEFVELIGLRRGMPPVSGCCEKDPTAKWNADNLREEWTRLSAMLPADFSPRRCTVQEQANAELIAWLKDAFIFEELVLPASEAASTISPPSALDLLRQLRAPEQAGERRRRQVRFAAAAVLPLLAVGWGCDRHLRGLDDKIAELTQEVDANARLLQAGERVADTETRLARTWQERRDWCALLEAVSRPLNAEADVRLTSLHGEYGRNGRGVEIRIAGAASNSAAVPQLMSGYAASEIPFSVSPLGLRPIRSAESDGVQFEIRLTSPVVETPQHGGRTHVE